jgi:hypothetical protein
VPLKDLRREGYVQAGPWSSKYAVASFGSSDVVLVRGDESEDIDYKQRIFMVSTIQRAKLFTNRLQNDLIISLSRCVKYSPTLAEDAVSMRRRRNQPQG